MLTSCQQHQLAQDRSGSDLLQELAAWTTFHSQFFVVASLPGAHVCFGCRRPWPSHEDISQPIALWQTKSLCDIMLLGCPCLLTLTAHGNEKIQPVNSESLEISALGEFFKGSFKDIMYWIEAADCPVFEAGEDRSELTVTPFLGPPTLCISVLGPEARHCQKTLLFTEISLVENV